MTGVIDTIKRTCGASMAGGGAHGVRDLDVSISDSDDDDG